MYEMPMLRLELDHMRQTILAALANYNEEVTKAVEDELEKVIANFDFSAAVSEVASKIIKSSIDSYFNYGKGRRMIEGAVLEALEKIFADNVEGE